METPPPYISWFNPPPSPMPLLEHHGYFSGSMQTQVGYMIYLPPGYPDEENAARYPVIYWLHGRGHTEKTDHCPPAIVDRAIRDGLIPPLIIVYANGGQLSWYTDSPDGRYMAETTVIRELIPHIDSTYRTIDSRDARAIQGMSMGGGGAIKFALKYPELFSSVVSFAGSLRGVADLRDDKDRGIIFRTMFGTEERFLSEHPMTLLPRMAEQIRGRLGIRLYIGTKDRQVLLDTNRAFVELLKQYNLPHDYIEVPEVGHDLVKLSDRVQAEGLAFAARHFRLG
jgi:enterochelin esterase-like enzyme